MHMVNNKVKWLFCGNRYGNLAASLRGGVVNLATTTQKASIVNKECLTSGGFFISDWPGFDLMLAISLG